MKGVTRFSKKGKVRPRYIGPLEIIYCVGTRLIDWPITILDCDVWI